MFSDWMQDARYAVRVLRKSPLFVAVAVLSLAIGIGADSAIFSLASSLLLRPVAGVSEPGRLVDLSHAFISGPPHPGNWPPLVIRSDDEWFR